MFAAAAAAAALVYAALLARLFYLERRRRRRRRDEYDERFRRGQCLSCGYDLRGATARCPECGRAIDPRDA